MVFNLGNRYNILLFHYPKIASSILPFTLLLNLLKCLSINPINKLEGLEFVNSPCQYLYRNCALNFVISASALPMVTTPN